MTPEWTLVGEATMNALPVIQEPEPIRWISAREYRRMRVINRYRFGFRYGRRIRYGRALHRARRKAGLR